MYRMDTEMIHVRISSKLKASATRTLKAMGLSVSDAVRLMLVRVDAERALPFAVKVPNTTTIAAMKEGRRTKLRSFKTVSDLMVDLNAND